MRPFIIISTFFFLISCKSKYSAEKYGIPNVYRDLIASFKTEDTLKFKDSKGNLSSYLITKIDSSFVDEGRGLMNVRGRKDIVISCQELTNPRKGYESYHLIILNKYPDEDSASFNLRLKDFYGIDSTELFVFRKDTVNANDISFTNYYSFLPSNHAEQADSNSVANIYMTNEEGIIAYRCINGEWWTRIK